MSLPHPDLYIDADACPVKDEVIRVAERHQLMVHMVSNQYLRIAADHPLIHRVVVAEGMDAADHWIAEHITATDICVTTDIPLAARCLEKGARVLAPTGRVMTNDSIGNALAMRDLMSHLRDMGEITGGPPSFTRQNRSQFLSALENLIQAIKRGR